MDSGGAGKTMEVPRALLYCRRRRWGSSLERIRQLGHFLLTYSLYAPGHTPPHGSPDAQVSSCKPVTLYFIVSTEVMVEMYKENQGIFRISMKTRQQALFCFACRCMDASENSYRHWQSWVHGLQNRDSTQTPRDQHYFLLSPVCVLQAVACSIFGIGIT